ncbi:hypothetical protein PFISCL1PPCAC_28202, partial [Pristionchus fissidentatus]
EMAQTLLAVIGFAAFAAVANAACAAVDNANCANWVRNGFCTNPGYPLSYRQSYCPKSCANSGCGPATTTTTTTTAKPGAPTAFVQNGNCDKWAKNVTNNFCGSPDVDIKQKEAICKTTCAADIAKKEDCALYIASATAIERKPSNRTTGTGTVVVTNVAAPSSIKSVYVGPTCTLNLYAAAAPTVGTNIAEAKVGTAGEFQKVTTATTAASYTCTCT